MTPPTVKELALTVTIRLPPSVTPPVPRSSVLDPRNVKSPLQFWALLFVVVRAAVTLSEPPLIVNVPVPRAPLFARLIMPAVSVTPPVAVFALSVVVPDDVFTTTANGPFPLPSLNAVRVNPPAPVPDSVSRDAVASALLIAFEFCSSVAELLVHVCVPEIRTDCTVTCPEPSAFVIPPAPIPRPPLIVSADVAPDPTATP